MKHPFLTIMMILAIVAIFGGGFFVFAKKIVEEEKALAREKAKWNQYSDSIEYNQNIAIMILEEQKWLLIHTDVQLDSSMRYRHRIFVDRADSFRQLRQQLKKQ